MATSVHLCIHRGVQDDTNISKDITKEVLYIKHLHFFPLQLSFSPSTPMNSHVRVLCLLVSLLLDCCGLAVVCGLLGASHGMHTLSFMAAEVRIISHNCIVNNGGLLRGCKKKSGPHDNITM